MLPTYRRVQPEPPQHTTLELPGRSVGRSKRIDCHFDDLILSLANATPIGWMLSARTFAPHQSFPRTHRERLWAWIALQSLLAVGEGRAIRKQVFEPRYIN